MFYCVKNLDNELLRDGFANRQEAKKVRDTLRTEGHHCVVSRSSRHPLGESQVQSHCLNTERTSQRDKRKAVAAAVAAAA